jgi:hypothetical protein
VVAKNKHEIHGYEYGLKLAHDPGQG